MMLKGPQTQMVDLRGAAAYPGFIDAHAHLLGLGNALRSVNLVGAPSYEEIVSRVVARARITPEGQWVTGNGWDQNRWPVKEFPTHDALSRAVPDHPVLLDRVDGHAVLANAAAMRAAGVSARTRDPVGGRIVRDARGNPTGVFVDNAMSLVSNAVPTPTPAQLSELLHAAAVESNKWGLTEVQDMGEDRATIEALESLASAKRLPLRTYEMVTDDSASLAYYFARGPKQAEYDGHVWVRGIKLYADGALGSRGAALLAPYSDDLLNTGLLVSTPEHLAVAHDRGAEARLPGEHARDRRSRQPQRARRVPGRAQCGSDRGCPFAHRARADHLAAGHSALRAARRDPQHAVEPPDERHAVGRAQVGTRAHSRRLRVAVAAQHGSRDSERHRLSRGAGESDHHLSLGGHAPGRRQLTAGRLVSRSADDARGGAALDDAVAGVRGLSGERARLDLGGQVRGLHDSQSRYHDSCTRADPRRAGGGDVRGWRARVSGEVVGADGAVRRARCASVRHQPHACRCNARRNGLAASSHAIRRHSTGFSRPGSCTRKTRA